ncbi:helix-turn-helix domain-containing protein [Paenibacillus macquariensis]|uniref:AraC-type DNA-binding protein n=1 Tax=Paenibacillus macquariensis TaxID=948756 RepID=A0ABY1K7P6_9BACL|nr:AraC family transcriptional regulator [Paenibacillus macquariensis]MEC0091130.1 helix-turn-helix domain-containing protein [Paenibacillus macquariensis]OAB33686.1 AraC family transcriptional regulator [Paenibacillus macquariensis subsp. macquariensis]SIR37939.1 AraC-type DNA-binding protein [Paenibacillus macquariensis]
MSLFENNFDTHSDAINEEVIYQNPLLFLKIWEISLEPHYCNAVENYPWHYHKEVEFIAVIEGHLGVQSKHNYVVLGPGDVIVLGASQPHRSHQPLSDVLHYVVFQIDLSKHFDQSTMPYLYCFSELTQPLDILNYIFDDNESAKREAYSFIMDIFKESQTRMRGYEIAVSSTIKRMILLLLRNDSRNVLNYAGETELSRLRPVLDYIDEHLNDKLCVEDACALLNLSYHYFIKYFKKTMGISFVEYINYKRIKRSELLLLTSELSIMEVGYEVGISNMAQFYKLFKRHNQCSPREFKLRMRSESKVTMEAIDHIHSKEDQG